MQRSFFLSIFISAVILLGLSLFLHYRDAHFDLVPLIVGNLLLAGISVLSFLMIKKGIKKSGHAFLRAKYSAMLLKFFICLGTLLGYIFLVGRENIYKPAVFLLLGMYVVYSALEAIPLSKMAKKQ
jgi:hypothetical protein